MVCQYYFIMHISIQKMCPDLIDNTHNQLVECYPYNPKASSPCTNLLLFKLQLIAYSFFFLSRESLKFLSFAYNCGHRWGTMLHPCLMCLVFMQVSQTWPGATMCSLTVRLITHPRQPTPLWENLDTRRQPHRRKWIDRC